MTNAEKNANDIILQECESGDWAVDKKTKQIHSCYGLDCSNCLFYEENSEGFSICRKNKIDWLNSEYKEPKVFSNADKSVVKALSKMNWIARDRNGSVFGYEKKPKKDVHEWKIDYEDIDTNYIELRYILDFSSAKFLPVLWEDKEPTSREEILGGEQ